MDELKESLSGFLSQPGAMDQVMRMAASLGLTPPEADNGDSPPGSPEAGSQEPKPEAVPSSASIPPETLQQLMKAAQELGKSDETTALLSALRPLLRPERQAKLDSAVKLYGLLRAARSIPGLMGQCL